MFLVAYILLLLLAVAIGGFAAQLRVRELRHGRLVQALAIIVGQNLPLSEGLRAAARNERKRLREKFERIARRLDVGDSLSTAVRMSMPSCPGRITGAIQGAEQGGTLSAVLRSLAADVRRSSTAVAGPNTPALYSLLLLIVVPLVVALIMLVIIPKFRVIFEDFGVDLPPATQLVIDVSNALGDALPIVLLGVAAVLAAVVQITLARHFMVRVPDWMSWPMVLLDGLVWRTPLLGRVARTQALTRQLPILHAGIRAGHDLPAAARQAACVDANYFARRRLRRWAGVLEHGGDPLDSARRLHFPGPLVRALAAARDGASLATTLEYLATYYRNVTEHLNRVVASALAPLVVLMWAFVVGFIVVALFLPLVALNNNLAGSVH